MFRSTPWQVQYSFKKNKTAILSLFCFLLLPKCWAAGLKTISVVHPVHLRRASSPSLSCIQFISIVHPVRLRRASSPSPSCIQSVSVVHPVRLHRASSPSPPIHPVRCHQHIQSFSANTSGYDGLSFCRIEHTTSVDLHSSADDAVI